MQEQRDKKELEIRTKQRETAHTADQIRKSQTEDFAIPSVDWSSLKLRPKMEISETPRSYLIASFIPGMKKEDIGIQLGRNTITVEGVREPTKQEMQQLIRLVRAQAREGIDPVEALLHIGAGRYGKFSESYRLPDHVDTENIAASYEAGNLKVIIPKILQQSYHHPFFPPSSRQSHPYFRNDEDFWW